MARNPIRLIVIAALVCAAFTRADAQKTIVAGVGVGTGVGQRETAASISGGLHGVAFVEAHLPVIPVGVRLDAMLLDAGKGSSGGPLSLSADGVFVIPIPVVQPYVLGGWAHYGVGRDQTVTGWNVGVGARITTGPLHVFGEMRRHQRLSRDLFTLGLTL